MLENLLFSLNIVMPLFFVMAFGYLLRQKNFLSDAFLKDANKLLFNITLPVMLFLDMAQTDLSRNFDPKFFWYCFGATLASILILWALSHLLIRDKTQVGEFVQAGYRSSAALLGTALMLKIFGSTEQAGVMILGSVPLYNIFAVLILVLESPDPVQRSQPLGPKLKNGGKRILHNPILLGIAGGFAYNLLGLPLPSVMVSTLDTLGGITTALGLLIIGAGFEPKAVSGRWGLTLAASTIKLIVMPAFCLLVGHCLRLDSAQMVAALVMGGSITTPTTYVMARQMGHEGTLSSSACLVTTLCSSITLTVWLFLLRSIGML